MRVTWCLLFLPFVALAADPLSDPEYRQATPLERIEGLFAHKWSGRELIQSTSRPMVENPARQTPETRKTMAPPYQG